MSADADPGLYDVAIIGMGPVGSTLANCLGLLGISTIVLDRQPASYHLPRAVSFDDEAMRIFQSIGLSDQIDAISEPGTGAIFVDPQDRTLVYWDRPLKRTGNGWYVNYRFHQPELEEVLRTGLDRFSCVEQRWNCEVTALEQGPGAVTLQVAEGGRAGEIRAAYVVGCDGGRSFTRGQIGTGLVDLGFHEEWLIVDLLLPEPESDPDRHTYHFCGTERMGSKVFVGSGRKRWEFRLNPEDDRAAVLEPDSIWPMLAKWISPDEAVLERATVYTFHSVLAGTWRRGRVFLAGDAAHQTPPFMGQGMCAGLRDAVNLGWKLARVLRDAAPESWLDTYQSERFDHVKAYIELTINLGRVINQTAQRVTKGEVSETAEGTQTLSQLRPAPGPGLHAGVQTGVCGTMLPQMRLANGDWLDDRVGYAPAVLLRAGVAAGVAGEVAGEVAGDCLAELRAAGVQVVADPGAQAQDWLVAQSAAAVLVRPDRYIMGIAETAAQVADLRPCAWRAALPA